MLASLSDSSSSEVMLSSVSASTPVVFSDSELEEESLEVVSASGSAAGAGSVELSSDDASGEERGVVGELAVTVALLAATSARRVFLAFARASLRSCFYNEKKAFLSHALSNR